MKSKFEFEIDGDTLFIISKVLDGDNNVVFSAKSQISVNEARAIADFMNNKG